MDGPRRRTGTIPVYGDVLITPDELQTWDALYRAAGNLTEVARALDLSPSTVENRLSDLYSGLHIVSVGCHHSKHDACLLAFDYLYPTIRYAHEHGIVWRRARRAYPRPRGDTRSLLEILAARRTSHL